MKNRIEYRLPEVLRSLMNKHKLSNRGLARELDTTESTVGRWLYSTSNPSVYSLMALSNLFGVSIDYLVYGEDSKGAAG